MPPQSTSVHLLVCQRWVKPDQHGQNQPHGYTLHLGMSQRNNHVQMYGQARKRSLSFHSYSLPDGQPYFCSVSHQRWLEVQRNGGTRRYQDDQCPTDDSVDELVLIGLGLLGYLPSKSVTADTSN